MNEAAWEIVRKAWVALGDDRELREVVGASPNVSTSRVYRLLLGEFGEIRRVGWSPTRPGGVPRK